MLEIKTIHVKIEDIELTLPHPACYVLHKVLIYKRRPKKEKQARDIEQIKRVLNFIQKQDETASLAEVYSQLHQKWQTKIISNLNEIGQIDIAAYLENPEL